MLNPKTSFPEISPLITHLLSALPDPVVGIDQQGIVRLCNDAMLQCVPFARDAFIGRPIGEVITSSQLLNVARTGKKQRWSKLALNGRTFLVNRSPLIIEGKSVGALASLHDISELDTVSRDLASVSMLVSELGGVIEAISDGIFVTDGEGVVLRVNNNYCRITGLAREELIGKSMKELVDRKVFDQSTTLHVIESGEPVTLIQKIRSGATVLVSGNPLRDAEGRLMRIVTTVRDLTDLNRIRDELSALTTLKSQYEEEITNLRKNAAGFGSIVVQSASMRAIFDLCLRLGMVDTTVLIQGESGVGKEIIAEAIHSNSNRRNKPFVKINCTAIPEQLLESELFGYVKGAFTGASAQGKVGLFETANGGTLLLDEIGDMALSLQAKLLRVLQDRKTRRIGDTVERETDVRILVATNRNLAEMVEENTFRRDLFYRINVVPLLVPPLRERQEDITLLTHSFLKKFCKRHQRDLKLHPSVIPLFLDYPWPGNVRELENVMERLVVMAPDHTITLSDIPQSMINLAAPAMLSIATEGRSLKSIVEEVETRLISEALARHGTTRKAAQALGIDQSNVVRKAKRQNA